MVSVLYVDDEPSLLEVTKAYLEMGEGLFVDTEQDPRAVRARLAGHYDVIVSDYQMPGMSGLDLLKSLRAEGVPTPFILFTGKGREDVAIDALNSGADFYLQKGGNPTVQFGELRNAILQLNERERAKAALRESEDKYRQLVESAGSIILKLGTDGKVVFINEFGMSYFRLTPGETLDRSLIGLIFDPSLYDEKGFARFIDKVRADPSRCHSAVHRNMRGDGEAAWVSWTVRPILDSRGEVQELLCTGTDITSRVRAEKELQRSHSLLSTVLESIDEGVAVISHSGYVEMFNENFPKMLGMPPSLMNVGSKEPVVSFIAATASNWQEITRALREIRNEPMENSFDVVEFKDGRVLEVRSSPLVVDGKLTARIWSLNYTRDSRRETDIPFSYSPALNHGEQPLGRK